MVVANWLCVGGVLGRVRSQKEDAMATISCRICGEEFMTRVTCKTAAVHLCSAGLEWACRLDALNGPREASTCWLSFGWFFVHFGYFAALTEPVDVYTSWIDACEAANAGEEGGDEFGAADDEAAAAGTEAAAASVTDDDL